MKSKKNTNKETPQEKALEAARAFVDKDSSKIDPMGSYTGKPTNNQETPTQDGDDI